MAKDAALSGLTVVNTRSREQAKELTDLLAARGATVIEFPTIRIAPMENREAVQSAVKIVATYDWIVFTSVNAVEYFIAQAWECGLSAFDFESAKICAVGAATADRIRTRGIRVDVVPRQFTAQNLAAAIREWGELHGKRVLVPCGDQARPILPKELRAAGALVDELVVYRNVPETPGEEEIRKLFEPQSPDAVLFTSPTTAANFSDILGPERMRRLAGKSIFVSIGPATTQKMNELQMMPGAEADPHDLDGMIEAVIRALRSGEKKRSR
jgi:uroporphyrinogen-III synthase